MPVIVVTIQLDVPDGTSVTVSPSESPSGPSSTSSVVPAAVMDRIQRLVPTRYREYVEQYVSRCADELGCNAELPNGERRDEYMNVFAPERCRRARVSAITYSSSRTAIYAGQPDLAQYDRAERTLSSGSYAYPKLPALDSEEAVNEAIDLTKLAIARFER